MGQFDTHGGYFAPNDYIRINEGGSHEENPYGGVQLGVDPQGVPNMVEEGESIYKDFVFSDNIVADKAFLEENHLPAKFAGKLYSEIADKFVDEAEDRPNDPISNNGLNAMLLRLAECQEAQKQAEEQKQLEEELANMSPEELAELEAMLAQQEEAPVEEMSPQEEMVAPVEPMPEEVVQQEAVPAPMPMRCGGPMKKFDDGGPFDDELSKILAEGKEKKRRAIEKEKEEKDLIRDYRLASLKRFFYNIEARNAKNNLEKQSSYLSGMSNAYLNGERVGLGIREEDEIMRQQKIVEKAKERNERMQQKLNEATNARDEAQKKMTLLRSPIVQNPVNENNSVIDTTGMIAPVDSMDVELNFDDEPGKVTVRSSGNFGFIIPSGGKARALACGGKMNRYDDGGWARFLEDLNNYSISRDRSTAQGMYRIDRGFPLYGYKDIYALEQSDPYKAFTQYVLNNPNDENVKKYLRTLDAGTADWTEKLFDGDTLKSNWKALYDARRNDQKGGIYHFSGAWDNLDDLGALARRRAVAVDAPVGFGSGFRVNTPNGTLLGMPTVTASTKAADAGTDVGEPVNSVSQSYIPLPTAGRYAKALGAAALGLYDLAQEPYKYQFPEIRPQAPWGTVNYQPLVYNPMDWAMAHNAISSQTNSALRSLRGTGPSQGANVIALDKNASEGLGNAFNQIWSANNQHRNEIIAGNNQTEGQRAGFDYGVAKDRAMLYDQAARMNFQKELYRQRLNQEEETAKYQALGNQIDAVNEALAGIGTENFRMNQANTNTALMGYQVVPNGMGGYKLVSLGKCGGTLLKKCKK